MRKKRALNEFEFVEKKENGKAQEELGKGAFGRVRLAIDKLTDTKVAIKTIPKKILKENASAEHLKREIKLHRKLDHPHIVKLYHSLEDEANVYLVLEYVPMGNLFVYLRKSKTLEEQEAFVYFLQTALAIDYLHKKGIIHRDLKPENILLDAQGNIKICDFGWSAELQPERRTFCGTLDYMCPEMMNSQNHDHRVDIWAMGILLFEMLHGFAPYNKNRASQEVVIKAIMNAGSTKLPFNDKISSDAKNLIQAILKVNPEERLSMEQILSHQWVKKNAAALGINVPEFVYEKGVNETVQSINDISINIENLGQITHQNTKPKSNYISQKLPESQQYNPSNYQSQQLPQQSQLQSQQLPPQQQQQIESNYNSKISNNQSIQQTNKPTFDALFQSTNLQQQSVTPPKVPQPQHSSSKSPLKLTAEQQKQKDQLLGSNPMDQDQRSNYQVQQYQEKQDLNVSKNSSLHQSNYSGISPNTKQLMSQQRQEVSPNSKKPIFDDKMAKSQMIINKYTQQQPNQQNMFLSQEFSKSPNKSDEFKKYQEKEQERKQKEEEFRKQQLLEIQKREEEYKKEELRLKEERQRQEEQERQKRLKEQEMENQRKIKEFEEEQRRQREQEKMRKQKEYEDMLQKQRQQELEKQKRDQELEQIRKEREEQERVRREQLLLEEKERNRQEQLQEQRRREDQQALFRKEQEEKQKREQEKWEREQKERLRKEREEQERQKKLQEEAYIQKQYEDKLKRQQESQNKNYEQQNKSTNQYQDLEESKKIQQLEQKARQEYQQFLINQSNASCNSQTTTSKQKRQISDDDLFVENTQNSYIPPKQKKQQNDEEFELEQKLHNMLVQNLELDLHPSLATKTVKPDEQSKLDWDISVIEQQKQTEIDQFEALQQIPPNQKTSQQRSVSPNTRQTRFTPRVTKMEERPTHINNMLDDQLDEWDLSEDPQIKLLNQLMEQPQRQKKEKKKIFEEVNHSAVQETQSQTQQTQSTNKFSFGEHKIKQQPETVEKIEESFRQDRSMRMNTSRDRSRNKIQPAKSTQQHKQQVQQPVEENSEEEQLENLKRSKSSNQDNTFDQKLQQFKKYDCDPYSNNFQNQTTDQYEYLYIRYKPRKSRISERQNRTIPSRPLQEMDFFDRLKFAFGCLSRRQ